VEYGDRNMTVPLGARPKVFISSTIRDFVDLRGAIKYWLDQQGYEVSLSEFTDFERQPDAGTLSSCFSAIERCQYYVLLVGKRRGSWYAVDERVSITQQEYRVAANLAKQNKIIPIVFIRAEVEFALRERRAALGGHLGQEDEQHDLLDLPSGLEDPSFTEQFFNEIKSTETARRQSSDPTEFLWYYRFHGFQDIAQALETLLLLRRPLRRLTSLANIRHELHWNLIKMSELRNGIVWFSPMWIRSLVTEITIPRKTPVVGHVFTLTPSQANRLWQFLLTAPYAGSLRWNALQWAIQSGEFLEFELQQQALRQTEELSVLIKLRDEIERYDGMVSQFNERRIAVWGATGESLKWRSPDIFIESFDLMSIYAMQIALENILAMSTMILGWIDGLAPLEMPQLLPASPVEGEDERRVESEVTVDQIRQLVQMMFHSSRSANA